MDAISLSFELFAICVKVYQLLLEASDMPPNSRYLQVRLRIERDKLVHWAVLANLSEDERTMSSGLRLNMQKVNGSLQDIRVVLLELVKLSGSYEVERDQTSIDSDYGSSDETTTTTAAPPPPPPADPSSARSSLTLQRKALSFVKTTRTFPRRLRWASFGGIEFKLLLAKLAALNETMVLFFDKRQQEVHVQMQHDSFVSILHGTDRFERLLDLMASLRATTKYRAMAGHEMQLVRLTRFKALNLAIEASEDGRDEALIKSHLGDSPPPPPPPPPLSSSTGMGGGAAARPICLAGEQLMIMGEDARGGRPCGAWGLYEDVPVWVEWRYYQPIDYRGQPPAYLESRFAKLATLLRDSQKPDAFRVPDCVGYLLDRDNFRFGLAFQGQGAYYPPRLCDLLVSRQPKPSLTTRLQMARAVARAVMYLHATSWTHKRLRSESIVFPYSISAGPYVAGFDYARPAAVEGARTAAEDMTGPELYAELYRHPAAQFHEPCEEVGNGGGGLGFRPLYDIYSLGVVLYEIGMWKPIHVILGVSAGDDGGNECENGKGNGHRTTTTTTKRNKLGVDEVREVQTRLLSQQGLMSLAAEVGDVYMAAVTSCLSGDFGFDGFDGAAERQGSYEARLQLEFGQRVIRKLDKITA
ncbi:prion-inhibition and propagation-domain-containing protein [Coniella lustricola]|uniref:Prion-inhibition and propagation-domain-containing protein n=1 Tax=Coniella lustricola TaxID=2025994 RepID=A0A2T2ZXY0_9PEZI|nr:prion-inhibition and propagation-domain-containing protein [Coniella lustricola]